MAAKKEYAQRRLTDVGTTRYPYLNKPDTKPFDGKPVVPKWKAPLVLDAAGAQKLIDDVMSDQKFGMPAAERLRDAAIETAKASGKAVAAKKHPSNAEQLVPYAALLDEAGVETGQFIVQFKSGTSYTKADGTVVQMRPKMFDSKGTELLPEAMNAEGLVIRRSQIPEIWTGSTMRVGYVHYPYYNAATNEYGVSLRLEAVKIIVPKSGGGGAGAGAYGMGDDEDGYSAEDQAEMGVDDTAADTATPASELPGDDEF